MKLIDADKILEALGVFTDKKHGDPHFLNGIETAREIIEQMPEAVVYCADCKYCNVVTENEWLDARCTWYRDKSIRPPVELTHFCRRGERRTNAKD